MSIIAIDTITGEWANPQLSITHEEGLVVAASVLPGTDPKRLDAFYASFMSVDPTTLEQWEFNEAATKILYDEFGNGWDDLYEDDQSRIIVGLQEAALVLAQRRLLDWILREPARIRVDPPQYVIVQTLNELDALSFESVVRSDGGVIYEKGDGDAWFETATETAWPASRIELPAQLLFTP